MVLDTRCELVFCICGSLPVDPVAPYWTVTHAVEPDRASVVQVTYKVDASFWVSVPISGAYVSPRRLAVFLTCPFENTVQHPPVQLVEGSLGVDVLVVGTPSAKDLVELCHLVPDRLPSRVSSGEILDLGLELAHICLTWSNEHDWFAMRPLVSTDVESQERESIVDMGDVCLVLAEFQLQLAFKERTGFFFELDGTRFIAIPEQEPIVGIPYEDGMSQPLPTTSPSFVAGQTAIPLPPPHIELVQVDIG